MSSGPDLRWQWCRLDELSAGQVYAVLAARVAVFVVEQNCAYQDLDGLDAEAEHLIAWSGAEVADFGFATVSEPYLEDDIPHVEMVLS